MCVYNPVLRATTMSYTRFVGQNILHDAKQHSDPQSLTHAHVYTQTHIYKYSYTHPCTQPLVHKHTGKYLYMERTIKIYRDRLNITLFLWQTDLKKALRQQL